MCQYYCGNGWCHSECAPMPQPECEVDADCPEDHFCALVDCANDGSDCWPYGVCMPLDTTCEPGESCTEPGQP